MTSTISRDSLSELQRRRARRAKRVFFRSREGRKHILRVKKTNLHLYLLIRDWESGRMLFSCSSLQLRIKKGGEENLIKITNSLLEKLKEKNISALSLDRGYHSYTGTLAKVREKLIEGGIQI